MFRLLGMNDDAVGGGWTRRQGSEESSVVHVYRQRGMAATHITARRAAEKHGLGLAGMATNGAQHPRDAALHQSRGTLFERQGDRAAAWEDLERIG